ncbi:hypothetical protein N9D66_02160 [Candidatus Nanopelagicales bacterium]|nr:hypothetical protein [Candidatus Nanopelagicales bacterium]
MAATSPRGRDLVIASMTVIGRPTTAISQELACSPRTVARARSRHRAWITEQRDHFADETAAGLLSMTGQALTTLAQLLDSPQDGVRFASAKFVLESSLRWRDQIDVERRLQALEGNHE